MSVHGSSKKNDDKGQNYCKKYFPKEFCNDDKCLKYCKMYYPKEFCEATELCDNSYLYYQRRDDGRRVKKPRGVWLDNQWVIPYNSYLLSKYQCHINVEICSSLKAVKYLYKYMYKGHDIAAVENRTIKKIPKTMMRLSIILKPVTYLHLKHPGGFTDIVFLKSNLMLSVFNFIFPTCRISHLIPTMMCIDFWKMIRYHGLH